jgi:hypothetical protein
VNQVLHADDAVLSKVLLNDLVVGQGDTLLVDLAITALLDNVSLAQNTGTICLL